MEVLPVGAESDWYAYSDPTGAWSDSRYSAEFSAGNANPAADSWSDLFKYGFGRAVDYGIARLQLQNTHAAAPLQPYQTRQAAAPAGGDAMALLLIGGAVVLLLAMK